MCHFLFAHVVAHPVLSFPFLISLHFFLISSPLFSVSFVCSFMYRPQKRHSWHNQPSASSFLLFSKLFCFSALNCFSIPPMWLEMSPFHKHYQPSHSQAKRGPFPSYTWKSHPPWTQVSVPFFQTSSTSHFPVWSSGFSNLSSVLPVSWQYPWNSVHPLSSII